jgi:hypothetical protein
VKMLSAGYSRKTLSSLISTTPRSLSILLVGPLCPTTALIINADSSQARISDANGWQDGLEKARAFVAELTLQEKSDMVTGMRLRDSTRRCPKHITELNYRSAWPMRG